MSSINILDKIIAESKLSKKETAKQQKIVETAITMFAEKGYANTSTSEIAKAAGVAEATIFRHYGTKENLLLSVVLPFLKESTPILAKEIIEGIRPENYNTFEEFIRALIDNRLSFVKENKEVFQIVVKEFIYRGDLLKEFIPNADQGVIDYLNKAIDMYKASGEIVDMPNKTIIRMIKCFIGGYAARRFILLKDNFVVDDIQELDNIVHFIMNGVKKPVGNIK